MTVQEEFASILRRLRGEHQPPEPLDTLAIKLAGDPPAEMRDQVRRRFQPVADTLEAGAKELFRLSRRAPPGALRVTILRAAGDVGERLRAFKLEWAELEAGLQQRRAETSAMAEELNAGFTAILEEA